MTFGLRGNRVWNGGSCSWISTPFSHFPPALFSLFSWIPFFCFPSTLVQSLLEGKKWKKWRGREEGFFPLSPYSHPLDVFPCSLFFAPPPVVFNRLLSGARRLVWFKGTELRPLYCFPYLKFNWSNNFEINNRCKKLEQLLVVLGPRAHSWHPVVTVGL